MNFDEFEKRLKKQTIRSIPTEWREEILKTTSSEGKTTEKLTKSRATPSLWRQWFWPSPIAWGALAAMWVVIIGLNMATPRPPGSANVDLAVLHAEAMHFLVAQRQMLEMQNGIQ